MIKKILILLVSLFVASSALFAEVYYLPYNMVNNTSYINLNDTATFNGTTKGKWIDSSVSAEDNYNNNEILGIVAFDDVEGEYKVNFNFGETDDWMFTSQKNHDNKIPFGLDLVVRVNINKEEPLDDLNPVISKGYKKGNSDMSLSEEVYIKVPGFKDGSQYTEIWIDIVLVVPKKDDVTAPEANYAEDDSYVASFSIDITKKNETTGKYDVPVGLYTVFMQGYYYQDNTGHETNAPEVVFIVTPNSGANNINLTELGNGEIVIGEYYYESKTNWYNNSTTHADTRPKYSISLSSSEDVYTQEKFLLVHNKLPDGMTPNDYTSICYEVGIKEKNSSDVLQWFNGQLSETNYGIPDKKVEGKIHNFETRPNFGNNEAVNYYDEREFIFKVADDADISKLTAGMYSSNIYVHLISNY